MSADHAARGWPAFLGRVVENGLAAGRSYAFQQAHVSGHAHFECLPWRCRQPRSRAAAKMAQLAGPSSDSCQSRPHLWYLRPQLSHTRLPPSFSRACLATCAHSGQTFMTRRSGPRATLQSRPPGHSTVSTTVSRAVESYMVMREPGGAMVRTWARVRTRWYSILAYTEDMSRK